jgi:hypothetical protein
MELHDNSSGCFQVEKFCGNIPPFPIFNERRLKEPYIHDLETLKSDICSQDGHVVHIFSIESLGI